MPSPETAQAERTQFNFIVGQVGLAQVLEWCAALALQKVESNFGGHRNIDRLEGWLRGLIFKTRQLEVYLRTAERAGNFCEPGEGENGSSTD